MCSHTPPCPAPSAPDREAAHTIVSHPEQGWSLLCNGVVIFEDTGELLPDGAFIAPHRPTDLAAFDLPGAYDRTGQSGAHRPMRSRATCRHTWQPVCLTGMPKLWAYTSSRGTTVVSTS